jgi:DHA1 family multidrug resistance protein-like MFS transporter
MRTNWQTTLWIMFAAQVISAIGFAVIFPFLPLYVAELGTNTSLSLEFWAAMVFSGQALAMALAAPVWGSLADRFGHKVMVERAMFGGALTLLLMGFVRSAEELVLLRVLQGLLTGTISAANALVASVAPRERMGYAMGMLQVGLWSGVAIGPLIGGIMADTLGFRATFVLTSALLLAAGFLVLVGVKAGGRPRPTPGKARVGMIQSWNAILHVAGVPMAYVLRFLSSLGQSMLLPFLPLFITMLMQNGDLVSTMTGLVVGVTSATSTAAAIYLGRLGDRIGHRRILIVSALAAGVFFVPQSFVTAPWQLLVLQGLSGAAWGGMPPALSALLARYTRAGSEGIVYGLDASLVAGARAAAPLVGALVVLLFGLRGIYGATALVFFLVAALAVLRLPEPQPVELAARATD